LNPRVDTSSGKRDAGPNLGRLPGLVSSEFALTAPWGQALGRRLQRRPMTAVTAIQKPKARPGVDVGPTRMVFRDGYVLEHSSEAKVPYWVCEHSTKQELTGNLPRTNPFKADPQLAGFPRAELSDYRGSGFDRGHMCPNGDFKNDERVRRETFFLSNIVPQVGRGFNQSIWADLEDQVREWTKTRNESWIITGPLFYDPDEDNPATADGLVNITVIGDDEVQVPTHLYKIIVAKKGGNWESIAFVMENTSHPDNEFSKFIQSIDWIEERSGFDFMRAPTSPSESMTMLSGVAGVGKSFIFDQLEKRSSPKVIRKCDVKKDLYRLEAISAAVTDVGQLPIDSSANRWFNVMAAARPTVDRDSVTAICNLLNEKLRPVLTPTSPNEIIVLDSIDEVHPIDAECILELVERIGNASGGAHFVVLGRPEGFRSFLTDPHGYPRSKSHFRIDPARYQTLADIDIFLRDKDPQSELSAEMTDQIRRDFAEQAVIRDSLGVLAHANFYYDVVKRARNAGAEFDEDTLFKDIFQNLLERNGKSHGRPATGTAPTDVQLYLKALEEIAMTHRDDVDPVGQFKVQYSDHIEIANGRSLLSLRVCDVLDYSGMVDCNPVEQQTRHYRFVPGWLHVYLLQQYLKRWFDPDRPAAGTVSRHDIKQATLRYRQPHRLAVCVGTPA
jgi:endonuclease G